MLLQKNSEFLFSFYGSTENESIGSFLMDTSRSGIFNFTDFAFLQLLVANGL